MKRAPLLAMGFDYGSERIGVAIGQVLTRSTTGLKTVRCYRGKPDWGMIARLIETWQPHTLVVGIPMAEDGSESLIARAARRFGHQLQGRYRLPVYWVDERLTSHMAEDILNQAGRRDPTAVDRLAAELILQTWLAEQE
jgi:putative Holliday junction resolvase